MKTDKRLGILIKENMRSVVVITLITMISGILVLYMENRKKQKSLLLI